MDRSTTRLAASLLVVAAALAGCADNDEESSNTTNDTTTTPTTPGNGTDPTSGGGPPQTDPRCLAPPPASLANATPTSASTRLGMPELGFTISDPSAQDPCYRFHGPRNATSGWNVLTLTYAAGGSGFHIMPMFFIGNRTQPELLQAFGPEGQPPEWAIPSGAVGGVTPGSNGSVAIDLKVGNYVYFCPIEGHMMQGMMGTLAVTQGGEPAEAPEPDATIELVNFNFTMPTSMRADVAVIEVVNRGTQPHEAPLVRLAQGATMVQFVEAVEDANATGPPPGALVGGVNAIAPGQTVYLIVDLESGTSYGLACFVESPQHGGAPHLALGMVAEFTVT